MSNRICRLCTSDLEEQVAVSRKQGVHANFVVKLPGVPELFRIRGLICGKCNTKFKDHQVTNFMEPHFIR